MQYEMPGVRESGVRAEGVPSTAQASGMGTEGVPLTAPKAEPEEPEPEPEPVSGYVSSALLERQTQMEIRETELAQAELEKTQAQIAELELARLRRAERHAELRANPKWERSPRWRGSATCMAPKCGVVFSKLWFTTCARVYPPFLRAKSRTSPNVWSFRAGRYHCFRCGSAVCFNCAQHSYDGLKVWLSKDKPHSVQTTTSAEPLQVCDACFDLEVAEAQQAPVGPHQEPVDQVLIGTAGLGTVTQHTNCHRALCLIKCPLVGTSGSGSLVDGTPVGFPRACILTNQHVLPDVDKARNAMVYFNFDGARSKPLHISLDPGFGFICHKDEHLDFCLVACSSEHDSDLTQTLSVADRMQLPAPLPMDAGAQVAKGWPITIWYRLWPTFVVVGELEFCTVCREQKLTLT
eukprot:COSAG02_NODE_6378_length_3611_cov_203.740319_4_plen_407_part_00